MVLSISCHFSVYLYIFLLALRRHCSEVACCVSGFVKHTYLQNKTLFPLYSALLSAKPHRALTRLTLAVGLSSFRSEAASSLASYSAWTSSLFFRTAWQSRKTPDVISIPAHSHIHSVHHYNTDFLFKS